MRLLLDTHAWLWFRTGSPRLGAEARGAMTDPANDVIVSVASAWEVGIKAATGKLALPQPFEAGWSLRWWASMSSKSRSVTSPPQ